MKDSNEIWGLSLSIDLKDCNPKKIRCAEHIKSYVSILCDIICMKKFGETTVVHFGEDEKVAGYSMTQLIETSLISAHFANHTNSAYIDIFSCRKFNTLDAEDFSKKYFEAKSSESNIVLRF